MLKTPAGRLRLIGFIEGISFLVLLLVAMPLKYLGGVPEAVMVVGSAHGALWILYLMALLLAAVAGRWSFRTLFEGGIASVIPLGPWFFDARLKRSGLA